MASTNDLIITAYRRFVAEVPALAKLPLVFRLELKGRGDVQVFRVEVPGPGEPVVSRQEPEDARCEVSIPRADFNVLAEKGTLGDWHDAWDKGLIKSGGDPAIRQLVANLVQRQEARSQLRRTH
ncbi:hypothetical protein HJD18_05615 [Thermoleophilia bacterium SCSIO 60948]|nr:hypothetical protein HJD18_05615 [Thermoleophilia bacterium SCSIO 60948]